MLPCLVVVDPTYYAKSYAETRGLSRHQKAYKELVHLLHR